MNIEYGKREWTSEELDGVREAVEDFRKRTNWPQAEIARKAEVPPSTLSQFMSAKYAGDNGALANKLSRWLTAHNEAQEFRQVAPKEPSFVQTRGALEVWAALQHAQVLNDTSVIVGPPGAGKTAAIRAYEARTPRVYVVTASPALSSPSAILGKFIEQFTDENGYSGRSLAQKSSVVRRVLVKGSLLVLDEAQHASLDALEELRAIVDAQKCGLSMAGNATVLRRLEGGGRNPAYAQLFGRIGHRTTLKKVSEADAALVLATMGIDAAEIMGVAMDILTKEDLRVLIKASRKALLLANGANENLEPKHMRAAYRQLTGETARAA